VDRHLEDKIYFMKFENMQSIEKAAEWIGDADCVLIGGGAGASTEAGMEYYIHKHKQPNASSNAAVTHAQNYAALRSITQHNAA
jgi:hypothetical protein